MIRTSLRLYHASRHVQHAMVNRNIPALGCTALKQNQTTPSFREKSTIAAVKQAEQPNFLKRIAKKLYDSSASKHISIGQLLYDKCSNEPEFVNFIKVLKLPDTFLSWFLITELHIWMVMTRCTPLEQRGRHMRNAMVKMLWDDSLIRMKKIQPTGTNKVMQDLNQQFRAALLAYDEGLQSSDVVLASALYRRFYSLEKELRAEELETLVSYVRRQINEMSKIKDDDFCSKPTFKWVPLKE